jgi:hypothetical protein
MSSKGHLPTLRKWCGLVLHPNTRFTDFTHRDGCAHREGVVLLRDQLRWRQLCTQQHALHGTCAVPVLLLVRSYPLQLQGLLHAASPLNSLAVAFIMHPMQCVVGMGPFTVRSLISCVKSAASVCSVSVQRLSVGGHVVSSFHS